jgi:hypothetical protein
MISYWLAVILFVLAWMVLNIVTFNLPKILKRPSLETTNLGIAWFVVCFLGAGVGLIVYWQYVPAVYLIQKGGREFYYDTMKLFTSQSTVMLSNKKEATVSASVVTYTEPDIVINDTPEIAYVERHEYSTSAVFGAPYAKDFLPYEIAASPEVDYFGKNERPPKSVSVESGDTVWRYWLFVKSEAAE